MTTYNLLAQAIKEGNIPLFESIMEKIKAISEHTYIQLYDDALEYLCEGHCKIINNVGLEVKVSNWHIFEDLYFTKEVLMSCSIIDEKI